MSKPTEIQVKNFRKSCPPFRSALWAAAGAQCIEVSKKRTRYEHISKSMLEFLGPAAWALFSVDGVVLDVKKVPKLNTLNSAFVSAVSYHGGVEAQIPEVVGADVWYAAVKGGLVKVGQVVATPRPQVAGGADEPPLETAGVKEMLMAGGRGGGSAPDDGPSMSKRARRSRWDVGPEVEYGEVASSVAGYGDVPGVLGGGGSLGLLPASACDMVDHAHRGVRSPGSGGGKGIVDSGAADVGGCGLTSPGQYYSGGGSGVHDGGASGGAGWYSGAGGRAGAVVDAALPGFGASGGGRWGQFESGQIGAGEACCGGGVGGADWSDVANVVTGGPVANSTPGLARDLFPDAHPGPLGLRDPCRERLELYSEPGLLVDAPLVKNWARHYPVGNPFVINQAQFEYLDNGGKPYALRIWPRGGRRKRGGNVVVYISDGVVDVNGNASARASLKNWIREWAWCSATAS